MGGIGSANKRIVVVVVGPAVYGSSFLHGLLRVDWNAEINGVGKGYYCVSQLLTAPKEQRGDPIFYCTVQVQWKVFFCPGGG
jgi:hypothetical protein